MRSLWHEQRLTSRPDEEEDRSANRPPICCTALQRNEGRRFLATEPDKKGAKRTNVAGYSKTRDDGTEILGGAYSTFIREEKGENGRLLGWVGGVRIPGLM